VAAWVRCSGLEVWCRGASPEVHSVLRLTFLVRDAEVFSFGTVGEICPFPLLALISFA